MPEQSNDATVIIALYAALTYDIISATNSSPQTTEINAAKRAASLMKWVQIGLVQAAGFAILGMVVASKTSAPTWAPGVGAGLAGVLLWCQYRHALKVGLEGGGEPTETY